MERQTRSVGPAIFAIVVMLASIAALIYFKKASTPTIKPQSQKPIIATTILPLTIATKNIVGDAADVISVLPRGADPHEVILSPSELVTLSRAHVVVKLGLGLDTWVDQGIAASGNHPIVISVGDLLGIPENSNPHVWLSPQRMTQMTALLSVQLQHALPESADIFYGNGEAYSSKLAALDVQFKTLSSAPEKTIVTLHNAFTYLAQDYGLTIAGYIEELPESTPTPSQVAAIISTLKKFPNVPLFAESEIQPAIVQSIAHDTGRTTHVLDPLEVGPTDADAYVRVMQKNLAELQAALGVIH